MRRSRLLIWGAVLGLLPQVATAATLKVGPSAPYKSLRAVAESKALADGDVIEIDGEGDYCGDVVTWTHDSLTVRGTGRRRPHVRACGAMEGGKGIWVVQGADFTVENVEFSEARLESLNGAAIRAEGAGSLTVRNCHFHDNDNGILGGGTHDQAAAAERKNTILIEFSVFEGNGAGDGKSHNLYISQRVDEFVFRHNLSFHAKVGHNLKSRAVKNVIAYNMFRDGAEGTASFQIDLPNGGLSYVIGNVIEQGPLASNSTLLAFANEVSTKSANPLQDLYVINNTFVNHRPEGGHFVRVESGELGAFVLLRNNVFYGPGTPWKSASGVKVVADYNYVAEKLDNRPRFANAAEYDFRPTTGSPLIDAGWRPGSGRGFELTPTFEYVGDAKTRPRKTIGRIDIGAFEYEPD